MEKRFEKDFIEKIILETRRNLWVVNKWDCFDSEVFIFHNYDKAKEQYNYLLSFLKEKLYLVDQENIDRSIEHGDLEIIDEEDRKEFRFYMYHDSHNLTLSSLNIL